MAETLKLSANTNKLHQVFGKKLYSNKYSFIAELCQNAVDSHRRSGQKDPVKVGIKQYGGKWWFTVKDTGASFDSIEDFKNRVCTILESDKSYDKTTTDEMGGHGIGSISVSAYSNVWHYTVAKNNRMFKATLKDVVGKGLMDDCDEIGYTTCYDEQYVLVEVPLDAKDLTTFIQNMLQKLAYFKDIMFDLDAEIIRMHKELLTLNTHFEIFQSDAFQVSTLSTHKSVHVVLDQYSYSIDWQELGVRPIPLNIGLTFTLSEGLEADLTRENLQLCDNYKQLIMDKIKLLSTWMVERYNGTVKDEYESVKEYAEKYNAAKTVLIIDKLKPYVIDEVVQYSTVKVKHLTFKDVSDDVVGKFLKLTNIGQHCFNLTHEITAGGKKISKNFSPGTYRGNPGISLLIKGTPSKAVWNYIKAFRKGSYLFEKRKTPLFDRKNYAGWSYSHFMNLKHGKAHMAQLYKGMGVNIWREKIKEFQKLEHIVEKELFTVIDDSFVIPEEAKGVKMKPAKRRSLTVDLENMEGDVSIKYAERALAGGWSCKFTDKLIKVKDLYKTPHLHIYGEEKDRAKLDLVYEMASRGSRHTMRACVINKTSQKYIKQLNLHNFMDVNDFLAGKHKEFRKIMTAHFIKTRLLDKYPTIFMYKELIGQHICSKMAEDMKMLENYSKSYSGNMGISSNHKDVVESLEKLALECKLVDETVWYILNEVQKNIEKFDFIDFFAPTLQLGSNNVYKANKTKAIIAMQDIARHRKVRMDWTYYQLFDFENVKK